MKLHKFKWKGFTFYVSDGEYYDCGSEGDFGHFVYMNWTLYSDPEGKVEVDDATFPDDFRISLYEAASNASERKHERWPDGSIQ